MNKEPVYTQTQVIGFLSNLVNGIGLCAKEQEMPKRYKQKVTVDGDEHWVSGRTLKDLMEGYLELCLEQGTVLPGFIAKAEEQAQVPLVSEYLPEFNKLYKNDQQTLTMINRERIVKNHILPKFGQSRLSDITTYHIQEWFNELDANDYSHETLLKIKNTFSPVFDSAVEDGYISKNPFKSKRLQIKGTPTEHHKAIPSNIMKDIRKLLPSIEDVRMLYMLGLLCYTGMRIEEILGLRWEDIDHKDNWIYIKRAVVHPTRNLPEIKVPKTKTSERRIPFPDALKTMLKKSRSNTGFVLYSKNDPSQETPLSYTEYRRLFKKIQETYNLSGYTAHDFRDTCATEWREAGLPTDVIAHLLGHAKSDITETRYVKYRDEVFQSARAIMNNQNGTHKGTKHKG